MAVRAFSLIAAVAYLVGVVLAGGLAEHWGLESGVVSATKVAGGLLLCWAFVLLLAHGGVEALLYLVALTVFVGAVRRVDGFMGSWWGGLVAGVLGVVVIPVSIAILWESYLDFRQAMTADRMDEKRRNE